MIPKYMQLDSHYLYRIIFNNINCKEIIFFVYNIVNLCIIIVQLLYSAGCRPPPQLPFGSPISGPGVIPVGGAAFYLCDINATLVGSDTIFCRDGGRWEEPPMCVPPGEYID